LKNNAPLLTEQIDALNPTRKKRKERRDKEEEGRR
jgi:hypothetical protein